MVVDGLKSEALEMAYDPRTRIKLLPRKESQ
jgi:hypothetical protein